MTKARDLANIISGGFTVDDLPTLTASEIPNLDAAKITSGTFADARIAASNVSQHATSFDDNKIVNDISTLAIRQASNENKGAYNTNSMYVDVFQDGTGIASNTNAPRNASEYVSTIVQSTTAEYQTTALDGTKMINHNMDAFTGAHFINGDTSGTYGGFVIYPSNYNKGWGYNVQGDNDFGSNFYVTEVQFWNHPTSSRLKRWKLQTSSDNSTYSDVQFTAGGLSSNNSSTIGLCADSTGWNSGSLTTPFNDGYFRVMYDGVHSGDGYAAPAEIKFSGYTLTVNATGSFESNAITASSSTNKMGAIITYQDFAGTNALNTDIVLKLSADGGSNYATATLTAMPDFATGIKMAKVNDLSVTAGTSLKYKIEFANQASGSKEARIRGVSLQY